mmetsp:Transcript_3497/g.7534  ORF Transcript_3497/g.7534 Transcript_3497/m.7534 type:complete len:196 (+) Transcript_3497:1069-1656(+)
MLAEELEEKKDDVVKKGNVNDFYSNLLKSNIAMGREIRETPAPVKEEKQEESESALDNYEGGTAPLDKYSALVDEEAGCDLVDAEAGVLAPALPGEIKEEAEIIKQEAEIAPPEGSMPSPPRKPRRTDLPEDMDYGEDGLLYQRMPWGYVLVDEDKDKRASAKRKTSDEVDAARARAQARAAERKKARLAAAAKK